MVGAEHDGNLTGVTSGNPALLEVAAGVRWIHRRADLGGEHEVGPPRVGDPARANHEATRGLLLAVAV